MQEVSYDSLYDIDEDQQNRADDRLVDEEGDEDGIGQVFTESQGYIQVIFGLIGHTGDLEIVEIVITVPKVLDVHRKVSAIRVNSHNHRPANGNYECQDAYDQVDCLSSFA